MSSAITKALLKQCDEVSALLKSISHPVRLKVLCQLMDGEKSVNELTEFCEISQSAMSQFLTRMKSDGVVVSRREGQFMYYSLLDPRLLQLMKALKNIYC